MDRSTWRPAGEVDGNPERRLVVTRPEKRLALPRSLEPAGQLALIPAALEAARLASWQRACHTRGTVPSDRERPLAHSPFPASRIQVQSSWATGFSSPPQSAAAAAQPSRTRGCPATATPRKTAGRIAGWCTHWTKWSGKVLWGGPGVGGRATQQAAREVDLCQLNAGNRRPGQVVDLRFGSQGVYASGGRRPLRLLERRSSGASTSAPMTFHVMNGDQASSPIIWNIPGHPAVRRYRRIHSS